MGLWWNSKAGKGFSMDAVGLVASAATRSLQEGQGQAGLTVRILRDEIQNDKDLVAQVVSGSQQISSQIYNGHGQVVPAPAGANVDAKT